MLSNQSWKYIGIISCIVTGIILLGLTSVFGIEVSTNLFKTGLHVNIVIGILQIIVGIAIYNNYL